MTPELLWKNLCFIRDGAHEVVADRTMRRLIDLGLVTLGRALTENGERALRKGDALWRGESPSLAPEDGPIRAWRGFEVKA